MTDRAVPTVKAILALMTVLAVLCAVPDAVPAHCLWLETPEEEVPAGERMRIDVGLNDGFEVTDVPDIALPKIKAPTVASESGETPALPSGGRNYEYLTASPVRAGSCVAWTEYEPVVLSHGEGRNLYVLTSKAVINAGGASDAFPTRPLGKAALEIVPLANPSGLKADGSLPVRVLFEGKPLPGAALLGDFRGFNPKGSLGAAKAYYCLTDGDGMAEFLPTRGGLWVLTVRHAVPNAERSEADETVHVANVTFRAGE
ncbi:MAG: DUF4198 domain-containing protein [Deltaproteobacteria bacterium]|nr:DUF4198 domain-containing protein [Deltaproteobacteria bacterium]